MSIEEKNVYKSSDPFPALEALKFCSDVDAHLNKKITDLTDKMNIYSEQYNDVETLRNILLNEVAININSEEINFEGTDIQTAIDRLHDHGILEGERVYRFTITDLERFKASLESKATQLRNKNQEPSLLIQPLLNILKLFVDIGKAIIEADERFKEKTNKI